MKSATPAPTIQEIRAAVTVIHEAVHNPDVCPIQVAGAHATLARARHTTASPVAEWLATYLDPHTTAHGPDSFRTAVTDLARNFKLPPANPRPTTTPHGEQGCLFD